MPVILLVTALVLVSSPVAAAPSHDPGPAADSIRNIARSLAPRGSTDYERARAIYGWVAGNIAYDVAAYLDGGTGDMSAEAVFTRRSGVCEGYVNLFLEMAEEVGVEARKVPGYAKAIDHVSGRRIEKSNHAWVAFRIDGEWRLADPTWGSGHVTPEYTFEPSFTWWYFDVDPELLILSHYPEDRRWQLLKKTVSQRTFERMATVPQPLRALGFTAQALRAAAEDGQQVGFALGVVADSALRVITAPVQAVLSTETSYEFELVWNGVKDVAVVVGDKWTPLTALEDGRFHGTIVPTAGQVMVAGETAEGWKTLLLYEAR